MTTSDPFSILKKLEKGRIQRELAIAQIIEQRRLAYKLAEEREKLKWTASGGLIACILATTSAYHHKNLIHLLPLAPITAAIGYNVHFCYGNKIEIRNKLTEEYLKTASLKKTSLTSITVKDVQRRLDETKAEKAENELFLRSLALSLWR